MYEVSETLFKKLKIKGNVQKLYVVTLTRLVTVISLHKYL